MENELTRSKWNEDVNVIQLDQGSQSMKKKKKKKKRVRLFEM